jgi:general secretion pathway protein D
MISRPASPRSSLLASIVCLPLVAAALAPAAAGAAAHATHDKHAAKTPETFTIDFPSVDIETASRAMSAIMDRPILVDPRVKGTITLFSDQPVTRARAFLIYQTAIRGAGNAIVESSGLLKVVPEADAKLQTGTVTVGEVAPQGEHGDQVVTQVFRLNNENVNNLVSVLRPLISANNTINANPGNNSLVITDYASNLVRLGAIIAALDTPSATDVEVIPLKNAVAADLAPIVQKLSEQTATASAAPSGAAATAQGGAAGGASAAAAGGLSVLADPHTNSLLVRAANPARLASTRALVARLDQPGANSSNIHVVYLKYTDATRLAQVLRAAFANDPTKVASSGGAGSGASAGVGGGGSGAIANAISSASSGSGGSDGASSQSTAAPSLGGFIQADPASNSLIVTAVDPLYRQLRATIDELDARRAQLVIESVVVEVDASKAVDLGMQWKTLFGITSSTDLSLSSIVEAIQATSGTNILSTANLVTLDNEEAKIVVGQNVPFVTGSYTSSSSSSSNPFQTIERKDVGVTLRIRPQIGANGTIRMAIYQESSSVASTAATGTESAGPTTNKRAIETNVVVGDGKIMVLGGLIEDSYTIDRESIPGLQELPLVGGFFKNLARTRKRTNLMVFLRPVIMRDDEQADRQTMDRYDYMRANQLQLQEGKPETLPGEDGVALPASPASPFRPAALPGVPSTVAEPNAAAR